MSSNLKRRARRAGQTEGRQETRSEEGVLDRKHLYENNLDKIE